MVVCFIAKLIFEKENSNNSLILIKLAVHQHNIYSFPYFNLFERKVVNMETRQHDNIFCITSKAKGLVRLSGKKYMSVYVPCAIFY